MRPVASHVHAVRALLLLALVILPGKAFAWGEEGHRMVGEIAERYLGAAARAQVALLLRDDRFADGQRSNRRTLGEVANWADEIKDAPWGRKRGTSGSSKTRNCRPGAGTRR